MQALALPFGSGGEKAAARPLPRLLVADLAVPSWSILYRKDLVDRLTLSGVRTVLCGVLRFQQLAWRRQAIGS